ncbi:GAF sensor signal transduction histidine kinase [Rippkaea orientalis PCC 8801]|uniref:histidine kinase n=1 Tax=Rippkaea orientalis (strain PCC 8801 / RF-1) TaxID=41431 RepID=B7JVK7_RIPO1|nr:DICT sensory domain-containing protein [Rippkaea orientalis]ACK64578.1 GAF sensor signal transduction histidine kinase [Rippkaea orientalis PCC 8801]
MSNSTSVLTQLLQIVPHWQPQMYFKASLTALSHAMEDQVLAGSDNPLVIASFQRERFYRQEAQRYQRIAQKTDQVYVLAAPETDFKNSSDIYETIAFEPTDSLAQEWHLVVIADDYASCLICHERTASKNPANQASSMDNSRRFEGIWTFDYQVSQQAANLLLERILSYRPELKDKITQARQQYLPSALLIEGAETLQSSETTNLTWDSPNKHPDPFVQRLVNYLQASQYKLLKANRSLALKEHKERLINSVTTAIRRSLDSEEILQLAVQKLGEGLGVCRCLVYRCKETDATATIQHEFLNEGIPSIKGQIWPLRNNPLFQEVVELRDALMIDNAQTDPRIIQETTPNQAEKSLQILVTSCSILSWLLVPILYRGQLLGMLELHHCGPNPIAWKSEDVALVNAIATQIGVALIQAEAYANLQDLNEQLEALDRTRSNLVAITGHELRTPLSTIQVCLESLATEPDMSPELRQVMLNTALQDAERMRKLVQDFLTLSQLESGRVEWNPEPLDLAECVELSLSHVRSRNRDGNLPNIQNLVTSDLPLIQADGEWLVEVLAKLLDNACKFTSPQGKVTIEVSRSYPTRLEVTVADTGRGIEPNRLETVFDRFYQEEGALRRSAGGTGLGLAICRQIVKGWGGEIWAESEGKDHGSQFHFTVPIFLDTIGQKTPTPESSVKISRSKKSSKKAKN